MHTRRYGGWLAAALLLLLTACSAPAAGQPTAEWVELDTEIDADSIVIRSAATDVPVVAEDLSLSEAEARLPFAVALPAVVPAGFAQDDVVQVVAPEQGAAPGGYASVIVTWENPDGAEAQLTISTIVADAPAVGAVGSGTAATVKGLPATLQETQGLGRDRVTLTWEMNGLAYRLSATGGALTGDDLLAMAESLP
ncbi:MAG: hypothetical protein IT317_15670 [Anaerolineales bacterium]|nr:hypothetical protein [Anaerolineales bacterium]